MCRNCGCAQALLDKAWHEDVKRIYSGYSPYYQGGGAEQSVFDQASGAAMARSRRLVQGMQTEVRLPATGRLLDIGCGNGALLQAFGDVFKQWTMAGVEVHEHLRPVVEKIKGVERMFTCPINEVPGVFPLVTLIHVLEHVPSPRDFLAQVWEKLAIGGVLLVQVPDWETNPFTLLVADHATHFSLPVLKRLVESAGYEVLLGANDWVMKELTVVARKSASERKSFALEGRTAFDGSALKHSMEWLAGMAESARRVSTGKSFGLFGTSIAASWLFGELDGAVDFFVDEDMNRIGKSCFGRPVYSPAETPCDAHVFISLPPKIAEGIRKRMELSGLKARFYAPDTLPESPV